VVDLAQKQSHFIGTPHPASGPRFSPDGTELVFNLHFGGDIEVAVVPLAGGKVEVLTRNGLDDREPGFTADGTRILYEAVARPSTGPIVSALASIPRVVPVEAP
jgi:Tol biopolymer transport system component